ncbi:hypothetical protein NCS52_00309900 [Fusarium sp. LHS14.1]|nr:hypothetical protein NCS52_00309900 [Fusarium sp. LHS14.1]
MFITEIPLLIDTDDTDIHRRQNSCIPSIPSSPIPAAAIIFLLLFTVATLWHAVLLFTRRTWYFIPLVIGGALEIVGYVTRYLGSKDLENLTFFIIQTLAIRSVFRFVEFTGDHDSPMMTSEAFIYICDSLLMYGVMAALLYLHPSEYIRAPKDMNSLEGEEL